MRFFDRSSFATQAGLGGQLSSDMREASRSRALSAIAWTIALGSLLLAPLGLMLAFLGSYAVLLSSVTAGFLAGFSLLRLKARQHEQAIVLHMAAMLATGGIFGAVEPGYADFGLAIAMLAPLYGAVFDTSFARLWGGLAAAAIVSFAASLMPAVQGLAPYSAGLELAAPATFLFFVLVTLFAGVQARRIGAQATRVQLHSFEHLAEHIQDALVRYSSEGQVVHHTRSAEQLFGCPLHQLDGAGIEERVHLLDRPAFLKALSDAAYGGTEQRLDVRMRQDNPNGGDAVARYIWIEAALAPVLPSAIAGGRHEVYAFLRDVSERHDYEREMAVARRTAEEASNAKSHFLATVGHELRTPLNAIVGFSEMMATGAAGALSSQHREYAEMIHQSGQHLLEIVNMLLDVSKIEAGKFEMQTELFAPQTLFAPCVQMVEKPARDRNIRITCDVAEPLPLIVADERACRQILINLLTNAIKFSHPGAEIRVGLRQRGVNVVLSVSDDGIGMDQETLDRLGEPFFQAETGTTRSHDGTGLGLSIVMGLAALHDGHVNAFSEGGKGTSIAVALPIAGPASSQTPKDETIVQFESQPSTNQWPEQKSVTS